jgi:hypothetical protein
VRQSLLATSHRSFWIGLNLKGRDMALLMGTVFGMGSGVCVDKVILRIPLMLMK